MSDSGLSEMWCCLSGLPLNRLCLWWRWQGEGADGGPQRGGGGEQQPAQHSRREPAGPDGRGVGQQQLPAEGRPQAALRAKRKAKTWQQFRVLDGCFFLFFFFIRQAVHYEVGEQTLGLVVCSFLLLLLSFFILACNAFLFSSKRLLKKELTLLSHHIRRKRNTCTVETGIMVQ